MKESSRIEASHVNTGTSISRGKFQGEIQSGRQLRHPKLTAEVERQETTPYGGLSLCSALVKSLKLPQRLEAGLRLMQERRPYTDADHVLTHAYNLYAGGSCIEDIAYMQSDEAVRRMLGAKRIPDPTTAGDFLRRFDAENLKGLERVIDDTHELVWRRAFGKKRRNLACLDLDSHVHPIYGDQKEGADFSYKGSYGYHPLVITLAQSQEVLRLVNRPGNATSAEGAAPLLEELLPRLERHFKKTLVRGDSAFAQQDIFDVCEEHEQHFAIVSAQHRNLVTIAESLSEAAWRPFQARPGQRKKGLRRRGTNLRRRTARARGKRDLRLRRQWFAEVSYQPSHSKQEFRLIIRRQKVEESCQGELFTIYRFRFVLTNLPEIYSADEVLRLTYRRCDQENVIEQLQNGVSAMGMPCASFAGNSAFLLCARLAFNLKSWLAMLALPIETIRWEWKRFRQAFVYLSARVVYKARQVIVRLADAHRFAGQLLAGFRLLQV